MNNELTRAILIGQCTANIEMLELSIKNGGSDTPHLVARDLEINRIALADLNASQALKEAVSRSLAMNNKPAEWRTTLDKCVENYQSTRAWYEENRDSPAALDDMERAEDQLAKFVKKCGFCIVLDLLDEIAELQERHKTAEPIHQLINFDDWYDTTKDIYDAVISAGGRGRIVYPAPSAAPVVTICLDGIIAAANWVDHQCETYDNEHGRRDNETGSFEFGNDAQRDYSETLAEIAEGIRALPPNAGGCDRKCRQAETDPKKYNIGESTMRHVFTPAGIADISDLQVVFDQIETALSRLESDPAKGCTALPDQSSDEVNAAAWKLHDMLTEHGPLNGHQFNNLKGCFYEALKVAMRNLQHKGG
ncbi:hypothetical protein ACV3J7_16675 [Salmonella enterica]